MVQNKLIELNASSYFNRSIDGKQQPFSEGCFDLIHAVGEAVGSNIQQLKPGIIGVAPIESDATALDEQRHAKLITPTQGTGVAASPDDMASLIMKDINRWINDVQIKLEGLQTISSGPTFESSQERENMMKAFMKKFGKTRAEAERFFGRGGDLAIPRHCSIERCDGPADVKVLVPYVFLSQVDFIRISNSFNDLASKSAVAQQKEALETMCRNIILTQVGSPSQVVKYEKRTMNDIWLEFFQVDFNIPELRNVKLDEIRTVNDGFSEAYESLLRAKEKWQEMDISEREWEIASTRNQKFYWVPASKVPGFAN